MVTTYKFNIGDIVYNTQNNKYGTVVSYENLYDGHNYCHIIYSEDYLTDIVDEYYLRKHTQLPDLI